MWRLMVEVGCYDVGVMGDGRRGPGVGRGAKNGFFMSDIRVSNQSIWYPLRILQSSTSSIPFS